MENESFQKLVTEINEGMEQVKQISASSSGDQERLLERMLGSYEEAQSILNRIATEGQPQSLISSSSSKIVKIRSIQSLMRSEKVRVTSTYSADDDGYSWRKYGDKPILKSKYPRSYYRCTHRHIQGCLATKQVERVGDDPYVCEVTYRGEHTCIRPALEAPAVGPKEQSEEIGNFLNFDM